MQTVSQYMLSLFTTLNRFFHYLEGGGSWKLLSHEQLILDACLASLPTTIRNHFLKQLEQVFFVERMSGGRINVLRFAQKPNRQIIVLSDFEDELYKVKFRANKKVHTANVTFFEGRLFSIEFKKPGKIYKGAEIEIISVEIGKPKDTFTRVVDRLEHGEMSSTGEREE